MPYFIRNNLLYRIYYNLIVAPFSYSLLRSFLVAFREVLKQSKTYLTISNYITRKPYFIYSKAQKYFRKLVDFFDKVANFLNDKLKVVLRESLIYKSSSNLVRDSIYNKLKIYTICFFCISLGYLIGLIVLNKSLNLIIFVAVLNIIVLVLGFNIEFIRNSLVFKFCKCLYKLVKM